MIFCSACLNSKYTLKTKAMEEGGKRKEGGGSIGTFDECASVNSVLEVPSFAGFPGVTTNPHFEFFPFAKL